MIPNTNNEPNSPNNNIMKNVVLATNDVRDKAITALNASDDEIITENDVLKTTLSIVIDEVLSDATTSDAISYDNVIDDTISSDNVDNDVLNNTTEDNLLVKIIKPEDITLSTDSDTSGDTSTNKTFIFSRCMTSIWNMMCCKPVEVLPINDVNVVDKVIVNNTPELTKGLVQSLTKESQTLSTDLPGQSQLLTPEVSEETQSLLQESSLILDVSEDVQSLLQESSENISSLTTSLPEQS